MPLDFPNNPTDNQEFNGYIYDATRGVWDVKLASDPLGTISLTTPAQGEVLSFDGTSWVNQEIVTNPYSSATNATDFFAIPKGTDAQRPENSQDGYIRFNSDTGEPEWYSSDISDWVKFREFPSLTFSVESLVIAGGGGAAHSGGTSNGGGGAGGYRSSVQGEFSGGGTQAEQPLFVSVGSQYLVTVGAGGAGKNSNGSGSNGSDSVFASISSVGGGGSGGSGNFPANPGGSGGGGGNGYSGSLVSGGSATAAQGFSGGSGAGNAANFASGGGGGAGAAGQNGNNATRGGDGGIGVESLIDGVATYRAGGGTGGSYTSGTYAGGLGGGGACGNGASGDAPGQNGSTNTGGGAGGSRWLSGGVASASGGSGVVIVKYPAERSINPAVGHTVSTITVGQYKVSTFTSGSGYITFS